MSDKTDWRQHGVRVVKGSELDSTTAQTPGMNRAAAITYANAGAQKLWAGTVTIHANAKTGAHHHGEVESVIYVVKGKARMRWGAQLEYTAEAGPGDFIYVPPYVPHQEINASRDEALECVLCRSGQEPVVVNLDITPGRAARGRALDRPDPSEIKPAPAPHCRTIVRPSTARLTARVQDEEMVEWHFANAIEKISSS